MDFNDLLTKQGYDLSKVMVMRHRPTEAGMRKVLPWLAAERPEVFNAYQRIQNRPAEEALTKAKVVASFIAQEGEKALFVGLYDCKGSRMVTGAEFWALRAAVQLKPFGLRLKGRRRRRLFNLKPSDICREWKGRLVVKWPSGRLWWRWAKSNNFLIEAIHEESLLDAEMPGWQELLLTWEDLRVLPTKWQEVLKQWRGIYYIFDAEVGQGYVGSACVRENILGRWQNYAASGHGGNKKLKKRDPANFLFTILQRTSPDMERDEICQLEASWKDRLHTRECGLNDN